MDKPRPIRIPVPGVRGRIGLGRAVRRLTTALGVRPCAPCAARAQRLDRRVELVPLRPPPRAAPVVSCLCVTEGRAAFMPWLLWSYDRQSYPERELVIVDSSPEPWHSERSDVRVLTAPLGTNIATKRNQALAAARGDIVAWFDDDDWQHPSRLEWLVRALETGPPIVGVSSAWFIDLGAARAERFQSGGRLLFNGAGFRTDVARSAAFDPRVQRGSDTLWLRGLALRKHSARLIDPLVASMWLCHAGNISNPAERRRCVTPLEQVASSLEPHAWADTEHQLAALRARLARRP